MLRNFRLSSQLTVVISLQQALGRGVCGRRSYLCLRCRIMQGIRERVAIFSTHFEALQTKPTLAGGRRYLLASSNMIDIERGITPTWVASGPRHRWPGCAKGVNSVGDVVCATEIRPFVGPITAYQSSPRHLLYRGSAVPHVDSLAV